VSESKKTTVTKFEVILNPVYLGKITVKLTTDGMKMSVLIITANEEVRNLLMSRAQSVRVMVELNGVTVERYEVVTAQQAELTVGKTEQDLLDKENGENQQNTEQEQSETEQDDVEVSFAEVVQQMI